MARLEVLRFPDERLRTIAKEVTVVDDQVREIVKDMLETMYDENGIGLAATQVDIHQRIVVIDVSEERDEPLVLINPQIIILLGSTAMESVTGLNNRISSERGKWKEIILKNKTFPSMITFSPSYLIRFPENKKYSWEDLKKIKQKIQDLMIKI